MDLTHTFTVPIPVEETWATFQDIASVAECFPGAQVTSAEGDTFSGTVKVKLGPIALVYSGSGTFVEKDESAHRFKVDAKGKDKRGNGTAGAMVTCTMTSAAEGTEVEVVTDLNITGKPAQFGRGVMQDVSDKLLGQFVSCLEQKLGPQADPEPEPTPVADAAQAASVAGGSSGSTGSHAASTPTAEASAPAQPKPATSTDSSRPAPPAAQDDALDLGAAVLPVLAKAYWKQAAAGLAGVAVLAWLVRLIRR